MRRSVEQDVVFHQHGHGSQDEGEEEVEVDVVPGAVELPGVETFSFVCEVFTKFSTKFHSWLIHGQVGRETKTVLVSFVFKMI